ncbi:hypothetical protein HYU23_03585 [Candidatus Woesearchaeota archaeon]|nr:hypothetical protein [Candidatus Woesearchaeota archaeon]
MKKGLVGITLIIALIIFGITLSVWIAFQMGISQKLLGSNVQVISTWVKARGATAGTSIIVPEEIPVIDLEPPLKIKSREELLWKAGKSPAAYKEIANSMIDCWNAFERGNIDFLNKIEKNTFCFQCRAITFSDEIKKEGTPMVDFNRYLNDTRTRGQNSLTYLQYLANDPNYFLSEEDLADDKIIADKDFYIFLYAASGRGIGNIVSNLLLGDDVVPEGEEKKTFRPTEVTRPQAESSGLSASEKAELAIAGVTTSAIGTPVATYVAKEKLKEVVSQNFAKELAKELGTQTVRSEAAVGRLTLEVAKDGSRKVTMQVAKLATEKASEKAIQKAAEKAATRAMAPALARVGIKFIPIVGWGITIATAAYGGYQVIWGEKPFIAKVMIVEPEKVYQICNL